jgi:opacity protein-like surface antigen
MKKILMSLTAMTAIVVAGGDIAPVEPVTNVDVSATKATDEGFYTGISAGAGQTFFNSDWSYFSTSNDNKVMYMLGAFGGYRYSIDPQWFVDGQVGVTTSFAGNQDFDRTDIDLTVRPGYRFTDKIDGYAILGASYVQFEGYGDKINDWSPQVGLGVSYDWTKSLSTGIEYTYNTSDFDSINDLKNDKILLTATYRF